ncbi:16S rRNA (cytidine(1402)-2'-O)-methyltransferase [Candidatus Campbellbacteria bacterium]|nr:MAG: 16S rRNA (cytidine(1402)-2'-O)-methyltransferase [Candidatus Campbellbacteria bacterium]
MSNQENQKGKFFVVGTPIGNLDEITKRAIDVLKEADYILAEDTRVTGKLLKRFDISKKMYSYNSFSSQEKSEKIIDSLKKGQKIALVSDAGTPTISDPGFKIVSEIYQNLSENEVEILPVAGPSALICALSVSGFTSSSFVFYGFLPHKKGRETIFKEIAQNTKTSVFYESPNRVLKALTSLEKFCEDKRQVFVIREISKLFEEKKRGSIKEVLNFFEQNPNKLKGEFVVVVDKVK